MQPPLSSKSCCTLWKNQKCSIHGIYMGLKFLQSIACMRFVRPIFGRFDTGITLTVGRCGKRGRNRHETNSKTMGSCSHYKKAYLECSPWKILHIPRDNRTFKRAGIHRTLQRCPQYIASHKAMNLGIDYQWEDTAKEGMGFRTSGGREFFSQHEVLWLRSRMARALAAAMILIDMQC